MKPDDLFRDRDLAVPTDRPRLTYQDTYRCPVCRHGEISAITLMDAFACNFCRHIFTANLQEQTIRVEDSSQPMVWRWNGRVWKVASQLDEDLTVLIWALGIMLVFLPSSLIWLSSYIFPPMQDSDWQWFPSFWLGLTFVSHFWFVAWLLAEHYQFPAYVTCKVQLQSRFRAR